MTKHEFIRSGLRKMWLRWPARSNALKNALLEKRKNPKTGRLANHFECAQCKGAFLATGVQVDHLSPIAKGEYTWDDYINRLLCPVEDLQVLCIQCHKEKTSREREENNHESC